MNCQDAKPLIGPYADGELEAAAILELEQHLESLSGLRASVAPSARFAKGDQAGRALLHRSGGIAAANQGGLALVGPSWGRRGGFGVGTGLTSRLAGRRRPAWRFWSR